MQIASITRLLPRRGVILVAGAIVFVFAGLAIYWSGYAITAGHQVVRPDVEMPMDYLLGFLWALILAVFIGAWPIRDEDKVNLLIAWLAKCYITLIFMLPYEAYYELDCFNYHYRMILDKDFLIWWNFDQPAVGVMVVLGFWQNRLIQSFHATKVSFAMVGLISVYLMYRAAVMTIRKEEPRLLLVFAFVPSIAFWSSIIGKDPIAFFGVSLYVWGIVKWNRSNAIRHLFAALFGIALAMTIRTWLGTILVLPVAYFFARAGRSPLRRLVFSGVGAVVFLRLLSKFAGGMGIATADDLVTRTRVLMRGFSAGGSGGSVDLTSSIVSLPLMVAFLPVGIITVLFRPFPGEIMNPFGILAGFENLVFIILAISCVRALRDSVVRRRMLAEPIFIWAVLLVIVWCSAYGLVSMENLGASVRFRLPIITVFVGLLMWVRVVRDQVNAERLATRRAAAQPAFQPFTQPHPAAAGLPQP